MSRVAVSFAQTRRAGSLGMFASLTPLRFAGGQMHTLPPQTPLGHPAALRRHGREMLYILNFYLPRFLDLPFREKLTTTLHELWHIGPKFDGDVRRLGRPLLRPRLVAKAVRRPGRGPFGPLAGIAPAGIALRLSAIALPRVGARHGRVYGRKVPVPKLVPLD